MIKIGCNFLSLKDTSVEDFIKTAYDLRLDVVDFHQRAFDGMSDEELGRIKLLCLKHGLPIGYIGVSGLFVGNAEEPRERRSQCSSRRWSEQVGVRDDREKS